MTRRLTVLALLVVTGVVIYAAIRAHRDLTDFEVYRTAALRAADAAPLYRADDGHYQFKYLPAFAVAARPLAWMAAETAKRVWFALSFGLCVAFVWILVRSLPDRRLPCLTLAAWTTAIMAKFFIRELALGQTNALLAILLVPAVVRPDRHPRLAGLATGAAVFVKPYAVLLLPWLALRQPRAATIGAALALLVGLMLPVVSYGWPGNLTLLHEWLRTVTETTAPNLFHPDNVSVASMWAKWLGGGAAAAVIALASAIALMLLMPLLSPQGWDYVLLLGTPVVVAAIDRWSELPPGARAVVISVGIVFAMPLRLFLSVDAYDLAMSTATVSVAAIVLVAIGGSLRARALL
jgi:hypothetical protein